MSQLPPGGLGTPTSPILKKNRKPFTGASSSRSPALSTRSKSTVSSVSTKPATNISSCSFKDIKSGTPLAEAPTASTPSRPLNVGHRQDQSKQTPQPALKKHSSFDQSTGGNLVNPISSGGVVFKRVKSSPVVSQLRSKEEIERKRKEALAKREEAGRRRVKSEEEAERKRREEAERKRREEAERKNVAEAREKEEAENYNRVMLREAEEKKKKE